MNPLSLTTPPGASSPVSIERIRRFARWWLDELQGMLPPSWRSDGSTSVSRYTQLWVNFSRNGAAGEVHVRVIGAKAPAPADTQPSVRVTAHDDAQVLRDALLPHLAPSGSPDTAVDAIVVLPPERVLCRDVTLPMAAQEDLAQILALQMEQLTPFSADQVYFGYRLEERDFARNQIVVTMCLTPRTALDLLLRRLSAAGIVVRGLFPAGALTDAEPIDLLPLEMRPKRAKKRFGLLSLLSVLVVAMALCALALPIVVKRQATIELLPWVEKARLAAESADRLRKEVDALVEARNFLPSKKRGRPTMLADLEELTRVLPDDTWAQQVDVRGYEVQVQGETGSASRLIALFEQSSLFANASFRSPLTKGTAGGSERYHLGAEIRRPATAASAAVPAPAVAASAPSSAASVSPPGGQP